MSAAVNCLHSGASTLEVYMLGLEKLAAGKATVAELSR